MAGYTRQSTGSIINGSPITAPPLNSEFNQLQAAFSATTGHSHDGSSGNSPKINLATSVDGFLPAANGGMGGKNKMDATTTPVVTNDNTEGYAPGSMWEDTTTGRIYICVGSSTGAAVWRELLQVQNGNAVLPEANDTVDLGSNSVRFQDLFLSAGIAAAGNATIGGTLNVTAATALGSTLGVTGDTTLVNLAATGTTTITSIDLNSGAIDGTTIGTSTPAAGTFTTLNANTSLVAATADINGGSVDGATIGASTPSTGAFTTLDASGTSTLATVDIGGGAIDGTVIGATSHTSGKFTTLQSTGQATLATADINGGTIDGATIGASSASTITGTTITGTSLVGPVTGNVTGNTAGTHTGPVTGAVTGNLTGNVTSSGTSTFNNVTIDGTLNMNAGTSATITNLSAPTNDNDAARKVDVDNAVANLVDSAPGTLDTLNELAAALGDDADFSTTITNSIATKLPLAGGTMTGAIAMSTNKITGAGDPTAAQDVATKAYVDTQDGLQVTKSGDTMSGNLAMGSNKVTGLATPTLGGDATNKTYVDGLFGSSVAAATSAANAATSEANAATSETNASNSASAAATSEANAAASYDDFDDRYLGAKSTAPTVDNDGDALDIGALYFNSTTNIMNVYGSGGWQSAGSAVNGTSDRNTYTATAGQTVFAATYDTGYVDVYLNGVKLLAGTDFTATNGTSIALASGATLNDVVDIVAYGTFVLADHYTKLQSDARYVEVAGDTMTGALNIGGNLAVDTNALYVDSSINKVGVGTNAPTQTMTVTDSGAGFIKANFKSTGSTHSSISFDNTGASDNSVRVGSQSNDFYVRTSGQERLRIDSDGDVGIGTNTSLSRKLTVSDDVNPKGYTIDLRTSGAYNSGYQSGMVFSAPYTSGGAITDLASIQGGKENTTDGHYGGRLTFHTRSNGGTDTERMRIKSDGTVQLNGQLDFVDSGSKIVRPTTNALAFNVGSIEAARFTSSGGAIFNNTENINQNFTVKASGSSNAIFVDGNGGNVGIGTSSTSNSYGAYKTPLIVEHSSGYGYVEIRSGSAANQAGLILNRQGNTGWLQAMDNNGKLKIAPMASIDQTGLTNAKDGSTGITINTSGSVGIGTSSPSETLDVLGTGQVTGGNSAGIDTRFTVASSGNGGSGRGVGLVLAPGGNSNSVEAVRLVGFQETSASTANNASFAVEVANGSGTLTERMNLNKNGSLSLYNGTNSIYQYVRAPGGLLGTFFAGSVNNSSADYDITHLNPATNNNSGAFLMTSRETSSPSLGRVRTFILFLNDTGIATTQLSTNGSTAASLSFSRPNETTLRVTASNYNVHYINIIPLAGAQF